VEAGTWGRAGRRRDICEGIYREHWRDRTKRVCGDEIKCRCGMIRRFGRHQLLATRNGAFAAIVRIRRRNTFALLAAVRGFLREWPAAEAVECFQKQEDCDNANRNVNATTHSLAYQDTRSRHVIPRESPPKQPNVASPFDYTLRSGSLSLAQPLRQFRPWKRARAPVPPVLR